MATISSAISVVIGGAVGASLGKAVSETTTSISDLRKKSEQDINALTNAMNLRKLNFSKLSEWKKKSLDLSKSVRESRAKMAGRLLEVLDPTAEIPLALPRDPELLAELFVVRYKVVTLGFNNF